MLAVPVDHPLAKSDSVDISEIRDEPFIDFSKNSDMKALTDQIFQKAKFEPNIKYRIEDDRSIAGFVEYHQGVALIPNMPQLDQTKVKLLHLKNNDIYHQIYMVLKDNRFLTPSVSRFQNF